MNLLVVAQKRNIIAARPACATNVVVKKSPPFLQKDFAPEGESVQTPMSFVDWLATFSLRMAVGAMTAIPVEPFS